MTCKGKLAIALLGLGLANGLYTADHEEKSIRDLEGFPHFGAPIAKHTKDGEIELNFKRKLLTSLDGLNEVNVDLNSVTSLNFDDNKIANISDDAFSAFSSLRTLRLGDNQLTHIPAALAILSKLEDLSLPLNQITAVDSYPLEKLKKLRSLNLYRNDIEYINLTLFSKVLSHQGANIDLQSNCINKTHEQELRKVWEKEGHDESTICLWHQKETRSLQTLGNGIKSAK